MGWFFIIGSDDGNEPNDMISTFNSAGILGKGLERVVFNLDGNNYRFANIMLWTMGLSFHYRGRIVNPDSLPELIDEAVDICKTFKWAYHIFEQQFPNDTIGKDTHDHQLYGLCFTPPKSETVSVCFLSNGRMSSPMLLQNWGNCQDPKVLKYLYMISVKTHYAGVAIHRNIIQFFRYLNEKYLTDFTMSDEGEYWETNDLELLKANFKRYTDLIDGFVFALENQSKEEGEDLESYLFRLAHQLHERRKKKE